MPANHGGIIEENIMQNVACIATTRTAAPRVADIDIAEPAVAAELLLTVPVIPSEMKMQIDGLSTIDLALLEGYLRRQARACEEVAAAARTTREGILASRKIASITGTIDLRSA